jgi:hypothetical protein
MLKFIARIVAIALIVVLIPVLGITWGDDGHKLINKTAAEHMPADAPAFIKAAAAHIEYLGPEPDRWRSPLEKPLVDSQAPDHFIDHGVRRLAQALCRRTANSYIRAIYQYRAAQSRGRRQHVSGEDRLPALHHHRGVRPAQGRASRVSPRARPRDCPPPTPRPTRSSTPDGSATTSATARIRCTYHQAIQRLGGRQPQGLHHRDTTSTARWRARS